MICTTFGYLDGKKINDPDDAKSGACLVYNGQDHCGNEHTPIHYEGFYCDNIGLLRSIFDCRRRVANACSHY